MGKKLLVADDSLTIQKVIKLALSSDGYEIQAVSDGNDALQQVAVFHPDVVLIDVGIPGRSAFDVKKAMNEDPDLKRIPVVLMSSAFEKVDEAKVALLQFEGRLTKPFDPTHLRQALQQALATRGDVESGAPSTAASAPEPTLQFSPEMSKKSNLPGMPEISLVSDLSGMPNLSADLNLPDFRVESPAPEERTKTFTAIQADPLWKDSPAASAPTPAQAPAQARPLPLPQNPFQTGTLGSSPRRDDDRMTSITLPEFQPEESDIRHLTESTVRMGALDEFGAWNIGEGGRLDVNPPVDLAPLTLETHSFLEENRLDLQVPGESYSDSLMNPEEIAPPKFDLTKTIQRPGKAADIPIASVVESEREGTAFIQTHLPNTNLSFAEPTVRTAQPVTSPAPAVVTAPTSAQAPAAQVDLTQLTAQIEAMVKTQVEKQLEVMAKKALPDIAEKVIRQEIRRILESIQ